MIINSAGYLLFLAVVSVAYYKFPLKYQNHILLIANAAFYLLSAPGFFLLIAATTIVSFLFGRLLRSGGKNRTLLFVLSLVLVLGPLLFYKYLGFFSDMVRSLFSLVNIRIGGLERSFILPLGISFYTLQTVGYLADVYRGKTEPENDLILYSVSVSFFPQIISGPIGRFADLRKQYGSERKLDYSEITAGLRRFLIGALRKVVIADGLGVIVSPIFADLHRYSSGTILAGVLLYGIQLYCDFAGYSDMAIGSARVLGIRLTENFFSPYHSSDMGEFWKRWHISLSAWFRDYVYIPAGGSRKGTVRKYLNIMLVFILSGLWHGASINFVIWGVINGVYRIFGDLFSAAGKKLFPGSGMRGNPATRALANIKVFLLFDLSLIFFRANSLPDARYIFWILYKERIQIPLVLKEVIDLAGSGIPADVKSIYYALYFVGIAAALIICAAMDIRINKAWKADPKIRTCDPLATVNTRPRWLLYWTMELLVLFFYILALTLQNGVASFIYGGF
ncbi:MAG: MBOAT family protein [Oscillospiraceae bacterium]|nr:MBOAT family protein [Oscillospiraceae bacterium]